MKKFFIVLIFIIFCANVIWAEEYSPIKDPTNPVICKIKIAEDIGMVDFHRLDLRRTEKSIKDMINFLGSTRYKMTTVNMTIVINEANKYRYVLGVINKEKELNKYIQEICQKDQEFARYWNSKLLSLSLEENHNLRTFYSSKNDSSGYSNIVNDEIINISADGNYYKTKIRIISLSNGSKLFTNLEKSSLE